MRPRGGPTGSLKGVTSRRSGPPIEAVVFVVGAASLGAEIAAARLLAPWFGASTIVWANTIATVLVALSVGYALGGRMADRDPTPSGLARIVLAAGALLAVVPFVSGPFLRISVDALESVSAGAFLGSLIGVSVLIAAPVLLLGMVSPYAIRLTVDRVENAGQVAGRLYAISTIGSLTGVFLAALLLIPLVGSRRTFLVFALGLVLVSIPWLRTRRTAATAMPLAMIGLIALPVGTLKATGGDRVIWERETEYQYARVVQDDDGERRLELNEGQAVHSVYRPGTFLTNNYWDELLVLPFGGARQEPRKVAILGNAAGTTARAIGHYAPQTLIDGVEIDGEITAVGKELFDLRAPRLRTHTADARPWLRRADDRYDAILIDAYRQPYIPFYLATKEFFRLVHDRLAPGGVVIINVGHPENSDALEKVLAATMRSVFGRDRVWRDPSQDVNTMLVGSTAGRAPAAALRSRLLTLPDELRPIAAATAARLEPARRGGRVYTDDIAPVEWLVDASIVDVAADGERGG